MKAMQRAESGTAPWIVKRGVRFGNKRKSVALGKRQRRRRTRSQLIVDLHQILETQLTQH